jgi:hypothetical protein
LELGLLENGFAEFAGLLQDGIVGLDFSLHGYNSIGNCG